MDDSFHDVLFPSSISFGSQGGPVRRTDVVTLASGHERRIARWSASRRRFDAGYGVRTRADLDAVLSFFEARQGRRYSFRWRDPFDHSSALGGATVSVNDQRIATGDGVMSRFALIKTYQSGGVSAVRTIVLPVAGSVTVAVDGVPTEVDVDRGEVIFDQPPAAGSVITAGYLFDIPVRFDTDALMLEIEPGGGGIPSIPMVEVRF